jgi:hypothetical protein
MQLYLEDENYVVVGLKYLLRAAKAGFKRAYGWKSKSWTSR